MKSIIQKTTTLALGVALSAGLSLSATAADWSVNEIQLQHGDLQKAFQGGGSASETGGTTIATFQHASGWKYGDNFYFFDYLDYGKTDTDTTSSTELYGELYSNFSLSKITGNDIGFGFVRDIGIIAGFNFAPEVDTHYYLPGVRFSLDLPGFAFANLDVMAYIQGTDSNPFGSASTEEDDSWMVDFNWAYPFSIGSTKWSLEGHVEYIDGADTKTTVGGTTTSGKRESWVLAQPQLRLDLGSFWDNPDQIFIGIEYQYWRNKLGDKNTDESVVQALLVWRL